MKEKRAGIDEEVEPPAAKKAKADTANDTEPQQENGHLNNADETDELEPQAGQQEKQGRKRKRVRVKKLRQDISKQLEFYFCDANLRKDRYMKELVAAGEYGWVNVNEFLKFNKIKILLDRKGIDGAEVARAAKDSELLEVSSDMTKVRRNLEKFPVKEKDPEVVDDCTIYVQGLPLSATIDSIRGLFTEFGVIEYVSLPRRPNGQHKGFGFVEFAEKTGAENACKFHNLQAGGTGFHTAAEEDRMHQSTKTEIAPNIQVISKKEWMQYKQQYLKLRKESAKMTKKFLSTFASSDRAESAHRGNQKEAPKGQAPDAGNEEIHGVDEENHEEVAEDNIANNDDEDSQNLPFFVAGCIVKFEAKSPLTKSAKTTLREIPDVVYVDLMENDPTAFLRFQSAEASRKFVESNVELTGIEVITKVILEGQEEELYWKRVESMRVKKRKRGREKQRGREKLHGRYEKHVANQEKEVLNRKIVFDE